MKLYSIKDTKAGSYAPQLMPYPNLYAALRDVTTLVNTNEKSLLFLYPGDFELYEIGEFDEKSGVLTTNIVFVENLANLKHREETQ